MKITNTIELQDALLVVERAKTAVLDIYNDTNTNTIEVTLKDDKSPLTHADTISHQILTTGLSKIDTTIPVVSEEQDTQTNAINMQNEYYWLIDPIDGTKEFISHAGQFTICVALMKNGAPIFGIVCAPALGELYYGGKEYGSFKVLESGDVITLSAQSAPQKIYGSVSNTNEATKLYIKEHYGDYDIESVGSQLKFTYVAEGKAQAYPRIGTDMKIWDVAAGHAIIEGAGGSVVRPDGSSIEYTDPEFLVGDFIANL